MNANAENSREGVVKVKRSSFLGGICLWYSCDVLSAR